MERASRSLRRLLEEASSNIEDSQQLLKQVETNIDLALYQRTAEKLRSSKTYVLEKERLLETVLSESVDEEMKELLDESSFICDKLCETLTLFESIIEREKRDLQELREYEREVREHELQMEKLAAERGKIELEKIKTTTEISRTNNTNNNSCTKLPKLAICIYNGNILKWQAFWDSFRSAVHDNTGLSAVDKLNYLRSFLAGNAYKTIEGLELTSSNYQVAISLLKQRFGQKAIVLTMHYQRLTSISISSNDTKQLRSTLDEIQIQLRSLEALGEVIENTPNVVMIKSKFPREVLQDLELRRDVLDTWKVETLIYHLDRYISSKEVTEHLNPTSSRNEQSKTNTRWSNDKSGAENRAHFSARPFKSTCQTLITGEHEREREYREFKKCFYCSQRHWSDECRTYATIESRKERIEGHCFNCLRLGHTIRACRKTRPCYYCKKAHSHHRSLCPLKFRHANQPEQSSPAVESDTTEELLLASGEATLMQTATTKVSNTTGTKTTSTRIFFDTGSHRSYISEELAKKLELKSSQRQSLTIFTFGTQTAKEIKTPIAFVKLHTLNGVSTTLTVNIVPQITGSITRVPMDAEEIKTLHDIDLADSLPNGSDSSVHFLVGNDYYSDFIGGEKRELKPGLYALSSKFGWILSGRHGRKDANTHESTLLAPSLPTVPSMSFDTVSQCEHISPDFLSDPKVNLERFWDLETLGIKDPIKETNNDKALQNFNETIFMEDNRYQVTWPWKEDTPHLPVNKDLAFGRLKSIFKRLNNDPENLQRYDGIIRDQLKQNIIEEADLTNDENTFKHYVPHHPVITPKKNTTKVRVVYDASAKTKPTNKSLNDCLYRGPVILENLCGLLIRFRSHAIGLVADIEKAFLQIGLQPSDRDVVRFLWIRDLSKPVNQENLVTYRFTRVPFGVVSSPFLLGATVKFHLQKVGSPISMTIKDNIYVDNLITGVDNNQEVEGFYHETKTIFTSASMNIREWNSNWSEFKTIIPECDRMKDDDCKVLGITWNTKDDCLVIDCPVDEVIMTPTKRFVLKAIARIFDPLGFCSPVTLRAKLFLQEMWNSGQEWDELPTERQESEWADIFIGLKNIPSVQIPRYVGVVVSISQELELHCFCDASAKAYATAIYLKVSDSSRKEVHLLFAKSRLCPSKTASIPRLELMAVLIGVRSVSFVKEQLRLPIKKITVWTDSQCVLHWLKSTKPLSVFVENRTKEIKEHPFDFRYVTSEENPADMATRGLTSKQFQNNEVWWHGPTWLKHDVICWPNFDFPNLDNETNKLVSSEVKGPKVLFEASNLAEEGPDRKLKVEDQFNILRFSSLIRLLRVTAWVRRFIRNLRGEKQSDSQLLPGEIVESRIFWERKIQSEAFEEVYKDIGNKKGNQFQDQFGLFIDGEGLLRCQNRMENSQAFVEAPKLLPRNHHFTNLVIQNIHEKLLHSGVSHTLCQIRREYWIPQGRSTVKKVLRKCLICCKHEGGPFKLPKMPPWPRERVIRSSPFTYVGLDYLGPLYVRERNEEEKVWICLFTCMSTRAVHLELVSDLSAKSFMLCLRRFMSRRGVPERIISDNASQFKLTKTTIERAWTNIVKDSDVKTYMANHDIKWFFITQFAPWQGGFYERLIGLVKRSLRKSIGRLTLSREQLNTLLTEVESVINSRPLVYVGEEFEVGHCIRPMDFLNIGGIGGYSMDRDYQFVKHKSANTLLETWKKGQQHLQQFWTIWRNEYLQALQERASVRHRTPKVASTNSPKCNEVVLVKENLPRGSWKIAKISSLIEGRDGLIRSAKIKIPSGKILVRPINSLYPLETTCSDILYSPCSSGSTSQLNSSSKK